MANNGIQKRIQKRVLDLAKKTGHWDPEKDFSDCAESMALFCIHHKDCPKKWKKKTLKQKE